MKLKNQLILTNTLQMTPQLQRAIRLLKISTLELGEELQYAVETNPMLEIKEHASHPITANPITSSNKRSNSNKFNNSIYDIQEPSPNLPQLIVEQLNDFNLTLREKTIAITIIDSMNEYGFLLNDLETLKNELLPINVTMDELTLVLSMIQKCDPVGIGARTIQESLLLQINNLEITHPLKEISHTILYKHFHLIAYKEKTTLKELYNLSDKTINALFKFIQSLNPRPGRSIHQNNNEYNIPDVYVRKDCNQWKVKNYLHTLPKLQINTHYTSLIEKGNNSETNIYLKQQLQEANWLLKSIENRHKTLLRVSQCIIDHQHEFLEHGEIAMTPLILQKIADEVGMHESTISRVTNNKYISTPRGLYELKFFFSSHLNTKEGGACSSTAIKAFIREAITHEPPHNPLSDEKISCLLMEEGIIISRRTVTKYRKSMNMASSNERKNALQVSLKKCKLLYKA